MGDNNRGKDNDKEKIGQRLKALNSGIDSAKDKAIADARAEAAERERDLYKQMMERAEAEAQRWREQAQTAQAAADRAQEIQALQLQLLPQRAGIKGFFGRVFGRKEGKEE